MKGDNLLYLIEWKVDGKVKTYVAEGFIERNAKLNELEEHNLNYIVHNDSKEYNPETCNKCKRNIDLTEAAYYKGNCKDCYKESLLAEV